MTKSNDAPEHGAAPKADASNRPADARLADNRLADDRLAATRRGARADPAQAAPAEIDLAPPDTLSLRRWWAAYGAYLLLLAVPLVLLASQESWHWSDWRHDFQKTFDSTSPAVKLLTMAIYLSVCTTFLPLPTGWLIVGMATRGAAVAGTLWATVLDVTLVGAVASTIANLNDYHLFTWMLRHHRVARLRQTRLHGRAAAWFAKSPFLLLFVFGLVPFPVDVARMLAATCRYGRLPFAAANLLGRIIRYTVFAFVAYWWNLGWIAVVALLALAVVMGLGKALASLIRR